MHLRNKVVLIAGGASGIGQAIAVACAQQGANVAFSYLSSNPEPTLERIRQYDRQALAIKADLTIEEQAEHLIQEAESTFGAIDVLICNTGGLVQKSRIVDMPLSLWNEVMSVNLTSTFLSCRAALRRMEPRQRGNIILISSLAGHNGGGAEATHYGASKGALITFTRGLAKEVGPLGIRVNGIAPGLIATRFQDNFNTLDNRNAAIKMTPLRREGTAEDVANAAIYLASDQASFLTGETIGVNGGYGLY